jgi:hypothetical protein
LPAETLVPNCSFWQVDIVGNFKKYKLSGVDKVQAELTQV